MHRITIKRWLLPTLAAFTLAGVAAGQEGRGGDDASVPAGRPLGPSAEWPLESVQLESGTVYRGLVQSIGEHEIEFMEVVRPPGKPMFLVIRPVPVRGTQVIRLPEAERQLLIERTNGFRSRVLIEAGRIDEVTLEPQTPNGTRHWRYAGPWFTLLSTADEETTRRCVVRIEQIFRAYRLILPPRTSPTRPLEVRLLGSTDEYRDYLRAQGPDLKNPSFYLVRQNRIVAASELTRFAERLARSRDEHEQIRQLCARLDADLPARLQQLAGQLESRGYSRAEIVVEVKARQNAWSHEKAAWLNKIKTANRRNDEKFDELTGSMFRRLYHEAFHAYLENYVYPHDRFHVPRWLNEGLAQMFESGQLEGDTLRIDAPDRPALLAVQEQLARDESVSLPRLLEAGETEFLTAHRSAAGPGRQIYYLSWAVTYYVTFVREPSIWDTTALDAYVTPDHSGLSPIARFERLVHTPLPEFWRQWRNAILALTPAPR